MLRLLGERWEAILDHEGVELRRASVPARRVVPPSNDDRPRWQAALDALEAGLDQLDIRNATLSVILGCALVRLRLLPWREEIETRHELAAYARISFEETYGAVARDWAVSIAGAGYGEPRLAAAVEQEFVDLLRQLAAKRGLRLRRMQPSLARLCHERRRVLPASFVLLLAEAGRSVIGLVRNGRWQSVHCDPGGDSDADLARVLARACLLLDLQPGNLPPLLVCAPRRREGLALPPVNGVVPQLLAEF